MKLISLFSVVVLAAFSCFAREAGTTKWIGAVGATGDWDDATQWDNGVPQAGDDVIISVVGKCWINLNHETPLLNSLFLQDGHNKPSESYPQTLICSNWTTRIQAKTVTVGIGGVITHAGPYKTEETASRVWIVADTLTVVDGGSISADNVGYAGNEKGNKEVGYGPSWTASGSGSVASHPQLAPVHAGVYVGNPGYGWPIFKAYDDPVYPCLPGSGGTATAKHAGGAIRLEVGTLTVNGTISASAANQKTGVATGGTGGSVWITCDTVTGGGTVRANAKHCAIASALQNAYAAGAGRVAVHYDPAKQGAIDDCAVRFEALASVFFNDVDFYGGTYGCDAGQKVELLLNIGEATAGEEAMMMNGFGTLYFTDATLMKGKGYRDGGWKFGGELLLGAPLGDLTFNDPVTFDKCQLIVREPGITVTANKGLNVFGTGYYARREMGVVFSNADVTVNGQLTLAGARFGVRDGTLTVNGPVVQTNAVFTMSTPYLGGELVAFAGPTNTPDAFGAEVTVNGDWLVGDKSVVHVECEMTNGAIVKISANGKLTVDADARIDSDMGGYFAGPGSASNYNPGPSHGGRGSGALASSLKPTYGDEKEPILPGSGGGQAYSSSRSYSRGGGAVLLEVARTLELNGTISADSNRKWGGNYLSPGSGGSVNVRAFRLTGSGSFSASGGVSDFYGIGYLTNTTKGVKYTCLTNMAAGAGGRIAVRTHPNGCAWSAAEKVSRALALPGPRIGTTYDKDGKLVSDYTKVFPDPIIYDAEPGTVYWGTLPVGMMLIIR